MKKSRTHFALICARERFLSFCGFPFLFQATEQQSRDKEAKARMSTLRTQEEARPVGSDRELLQGIVVRKRKGNNESLR